MNKEMRDLRGYEWTGKRKTGKGLSLAYCSRVNQTAGSIDKGLPEDNVYILFETWFIAFGDQLWWPNSRKEKYWEGASLSMLRRCSHFNQTAGSLTKVSREIMYILLETLLMSFRDRTWQTNGGKEEDWEEA